MITSEITSKFVIAFNYIIPFTLVTQESGIFSIFPTTSMGFSAFAAMLTKLSLSLATDHNIDFFSDNG